MTRAVCHAWIRQRTECECQARGRIRSARVRNEQRRLRSAQHSLCPPTRATSPLSSSEIPSPQSPPSSMPPRSATTAIIVHLFLLHLVTHYPSRGEHAGTVRAEHSLPTIPLWFTFLASGRGVPSFTPLLCEWRDAPGRRWIYRPLPTLFSCALNPHMCVSRADRQANKMEVNGAAVEYGL
jgi:hypothetical protein